MNYTPLNTVTPDALLMATALLMTRPPMGRDLEVSFEDAVELALAVQNRFRADEPTAEEERSAEAVDRHYLAEAARAIAATRIASSRRLAVLPLNDDWVVKPDGDNDSRVNLAHSTPLLAVLTWARLHAPEDLVGHGIDPRSETFELLDAESLAAIATAQNGRGT